MAYASMIDIVPQGIGYRTSRRPAMPMIGR